MNMNSILIPIIVGVGLSFLFVVDHLREPHINIDPKILEFYGEFVLESDTTVHSVNLVEEDILAIVLRVAKAPTGHVVMDDPLPLFRELFPDENVTTLVVTADGREVPHYTENNLLRFNTTNAKFVVIKGEQ